MHPYSSTDERQGAHSHMGARIGWRFMVFLVLIGSSRARTSPGLSATLPYEGRDQEPKRGDGGKYLTPLSSEERGWG